jgi:hypothetical protein
LTFLAVMHSLPEVMRVSAMPTSPSSRLMPRQKVMMDSLWPMDLNGKWRVENGK